MAFVNKEIPQCNCIVCQNDLDQCIGMECENKEKREGKMDTKEKLIEIYNRKEFPMYNLGTTNDGKNITYKKVQLISFIKYFTKLLAYGPIDADEYISEGHIDIVVLTENMLNDDINNMEKCENINEAIDHLLNMNNDWNIYWPAKEIFPYVLEQIYNKKPLDKKYWGW